MIIANYHTHTARCQHAKGEDRAYVEEAIAGGLKVLGFSDHCPWVFPKEYVSRTRMRPEELDDYFTSLEQLRREYARDITIYIGFETEYVPDMMEEQRRLLEGYPIDYRILGEHFTENEMHSVYTGFPSNDASVLQRYVDLVIEALETGDYLYPAHPDLMHFTGADEIYDEQFRRLCVYCKEKQFPLEINLLGLVESRHYPSRRFWKIAEEVGNSAIIGCDAHTPDRLSNQKYIRMCEDWAAQFHLPLVQMLPNFGTK